MHEISLLEKVIKSILTDLKTQGISNSKMIREISMDVGALELHSEESFRQAFQSLAKGTLLSRVKLNLNVMAPQIECIRCGHKGPCEDKHADHRDPMPYAPCPCCGELILLSGGRGVGKISLIIDEPAVAESPN